MPQHSIIGIHHLDAGLVLAPERYDPRRRINTSPSSSVSDFAEVIRDQIGAEKADPAGRYLVLDTSDAREGIVLTNRVPVSSKTIGSMKKIARPGDVIISRLRPYLRQVALIDVALTESKQGPVTVLCSTEFFVLRSRDTYSIAFLVPCLLSDSVQAVLSVSQEGGHHPRFNQPTLETLPVPEDIAKERNGISSSVESAIGYIRKGDLTMRTLVQTCSRQIVLQAPVEED